jgi:hypothetical protein
MMNNKHRNYKINWIKDYYKLLYKTIYKNISTGQDSIRLVNSWWNEWLREAENLIIKTNHFK